MAKLRRNLLIFKHFIKNQFQMIRKILLFVLIFSFSIIAFSQKKEETKKATWDVNNPHKDWKYKNFNLKT